MRKILLGLAAATLAMPAAVFAQSYGSSYGPSFVWVPSGDFGVYYSYADQKVDQASKNPSGSGIGFSGQLDLPLNLFIDGLYQYNDENVAQFTDSSGNAVDGFGLEEQARVGGGLQFFVPATPLTLYAKAEYVHYRQEGPTFYDPYYGYVTTGHNNDDGGGYFLGFKTGWPGLEIYGQGGYLRLSDTQGQDYKVGFAVPISRIMRRRATVQFFGEFDLTSLHEHDGPYHDIYYDYHAGIRIPFY